MKITKRQLAAFNRLSPKLGGITFNEAYNASQGLPGPDERAWLLGLQRQLHGLERAPLTWKDVSTSN
jgi:hypothetical protein